MITKQSEFINFKKNVFSKMDKSGAGGIDTKIKNLCDKINQRNDIFTLSSCSGRISILKNNTSGKIEDIYIFTSHNLTTPQEINQALNRYKESEQKEELYFMQEAMIMHICVNSLKLGLKLIEIAKTCGLNQCGIISASKKIVIEVICDARIELPIYDKELLFSEDYLERIIEKANSNQEKSWETIQKLTDKLDNIKIE
jgi:tRNA wybutosine-synthesizing protein 3